MWWRHLIAIPDALRLTASSRNQNPEVEGAKSKALLTLRGHTVLYNQIRAKFSPLHSTGQQFAYSGSADGDWVVWDLTTGVKVNLPLCWIVRHFCTFLRVAAPKPREFGGGTGCRVAPLGTSVDHLECERVPHLLELPIT